MKCSLVTYALPELVVNLSEKGMVGFTIPWSRIYDDNLQQHDTRVDPSRLPLLHIWMSSGAYTRQGVLAYLVFFGLRRAHSLEPKSVAGGRSPLVSHV